MAAGQGFASMPESQHRLASAIGSLTRWSRVNSRDARTAALAPARAAMRRRWEAEADPDGVLSPNELEAAVKRLQAAHMRRMALASAKKRAAKPAA
ncbi:hypothetical protein [Phytohabitans aurantiacus]|uniref:EF-hand domain-containing protein n=1 Tax=Phytohabitans aurantiacus TaxID=3016789 RepID=A0ABQ5QSX6_9ACTN|nr:hypothetical protein [Phytohabitans aurantiacus]GLH97385.1 hypothetical protein Pa4123_26600 [Phytohabitans aurantiacus]